jgi:murein DD-endopeptidase MepM/ murein hydrolase activator NlpD
VPSRTTRPKINLRPTLPIAAVVLGLLVALAPGASGAAEPLDGEAADRTAAGEEGEPAEASTSAGRRARLRLADTRPRKTFFDGRRKARFNFELAGTESQNLVVKAIKLSNSKTMKRWRLNDVEPNQTQRINWNGNRNGGGFTGQGRHVFKVFRPGGEKADTERADGKSRFRYFKHHFPILGRHSFGDGYGAGRGHRGQDIFAKCGKKIRAARGGRVKVRRYQSSAGYYLVIAGRKTGRDYVYMHLQKRERAKLGARVRTGEVIGRNGETGNASGCHLHFEIWSAPGWYEGGKPMRNVASQTRKWAGWT